MDHLLITAVFYSLHNAKSMSIFSIQCDCSLLCPYHSGTVSDTQRINSIYFIFVLRLVMRTWAILDLAINLCLQ